MYSILVCKSLYFIFSDTYSNAWLLRAVQKASNGERLVGKDVKGSSRHLPRGSEENRENLHSGLSGPIIEPRTFRIKSSNN